MNASPMFVIVGAGGTGRECLDTALALDRPVSAFVDERLAGQVVRGLAVIGPNELSGDFTYVVGIADPGVRRRLATELDRLGGAATDLIHPRATVAPDTEFGEGAIVFGGAYVSSSVCFGVHGQVQYNATVGHDTVAGDFVSVYPGANVSGSVRLADDSTVGSGAVVLQGRSVGRSGFVGAGAVVTHDVDEDTCVIGSPARPLASG